MCLRGWYLCCIQTSLGTVPPNISLLNSGVSSKTWRSWILARTNQRVNILGMTRTFVLSYVTCELAHLQQGTGFSILFLFNFPFNIFCTLKEGVNSLFCSTHVGEKAGCPVSVPGRVELDKMVDVKDFTLVSAEGLSSSLSSFSYLASSFGKKRNYALWKGTFRKITRAAQKHSHPSLLSLL